MNAFGLPVVDVDKCTACNDCVEACPLELFTLMPLDHKLLVQCRNLLDGEDATAVCSVACNACGRCVSDAAPGLISMQSGLAVIDYEKIELGHARRHGPLPHRRDPLAGRAAVRHPGPGAHGARPGQRAELT
jgi:ferredoxin